MNKKQKHFESIQPGAPNSNRVVTINGKPDLSFALRKWKKQLKDSGIIEELKRRKEYEKPSVLRQRMKSRREFLSRKPLDDC